MQGGINYTHCLQGEDYEEIQHTLLQKIDEDVNEELKKNTCNKFNHIKAFVKVDGMIVSAWVSITQAKRLFVSSNL